MNEPVASRPHVPGYGISQSLDGLLSWSEVEKSLEAARSYWLVTTSVDGSPHSRPVDGIWLDGVLYFGGGGTRWSRNLRENPRAEVHLESTQRVVILEGEVERVSANAHGMEEVNEAGKRITATSTQEIDGRSGQASPRMDRLPCRCDSLAIPAGIDSSSP
jgi:nitroimidazol reductase NimA-like FMN-containing flavoprotein (pyridoxamine 5'-phosphate oxidase superfamily)